MQMVGDRKRGFANAFEKPHPWQNFLREPIRGRKVFHDIVHGNPEALEKEDFFLDTRMLFFYSSQAKIDGNPVTIQTHNPWGLELSAMGIQSLLTEKRADLIKEWRNVIIASYPKDSQSFLKGQRVSSQTL